MYHQRVRWKERPIRRGRERGGHDEKGNLCPDHAIFRSTINTVKNNRTGRETKCVTSKTNNSSVSIDLSKEFLDLCDHRTLWWDDFLGEQ